MRHKRMRHRRWKVPRWCVGALVTMLSLLLAEPWLPGTGQAAGAPRPGLSQVRVLAIAPFADEVALSKFLADWGAARLSELLMRGPFQVVGPSRVAEAMKRLGLTPASLISPTRTVELGKEVGADAVLTGRITWVLRESDRERDPQGRPLGGGIISRVDVDVRILQVGTRLTLFQEDFICVVPSTEQVAMDCAMRDVARRLLPGL